VIQGFDLRITLRQAQGDIEFFCESRCNYQKKFTKRNLPKEVYQKKFTKRSLPKEVYQKKFIKRSLPKEMVIVP